MIFSPNNLPASKALFTGRTKDLEKIFSIINLGNCISLYGERKSGKTLTLLIIKDIINGDIKKDKLIDLTLRNQIPKWEIQFINYKAIYVSLEATRNQEDLANKFLKELKKVYSSHQSIQNICTTSSYNNLGTLLDTIHEIIEKEQQQLVVLIDEMEILEDYQKQDGDIVADLFCERTRYPNTFFIHVGSHQWLERISKPGSTFTHLQYLYLKSIDENDNTKFLLSSLNSTLQELVIEMAESKPLYTQYIGQFITNKDEFTNKNFVLTTEKKVLLENELLNDTTFCQYIKQNIYQEKRLDNNSKKLLAAFIYKPNSTIEELSKLLNISEVEINNKITTFVNFGTVIKRRGKYEIVGKLIERYGKTICDNPWLQNPPDPKHLILKPSNPNGQDLEIVIGIKQDKVALFQWNKLKEELYKVCNGEISSINKEKEKKGIYSFIWSGVDISKVLASAKNGNLDKSIISTGADTLLEILTKDEECIYQFIPKIDFNEPKIKTINLDEIKKLKKHTKVLIMTFNDREKKALLHIMKPWPNEQEIFQGPISKHTYRFGQFGNYHAVHVQVQMGQDERSSTRNIIGTAISELKPKIILLLGVAFGFDNKNHRFGDILVAQKIQPYEYSKKERLGNTSYRGTLRECGQTLEDRLTNHIWSHYWIEGIEGKKVQTLPGLVLSGNKLVNNKKFKDGLYKAFKHLSPIGGEMEGSAGYSAVDYIDRNIEIVLVKGICDWGDGNKNDDAQPFAAFTAISLVDHILSQPDVLLTLGIDSVTSQSKPAKAIKKSQISKSEKMSKKILAETEMVAIEILSNQKVSKINTDPINITLTDKLKLVDKLLKCPSIRNTSRRKTVITQLGDIKNDISEDPSSKTEVTNIVDACLTHPTGLKTLINIVRFMDNNTIPLVELEEFLRKHSILSD